jgi:hypothetical protein
MSIAEVMIWSRVLSGCDIDVSTRTLNCPRHDMVVGDLILFDSCIYMLGTLHKLWRDIRAL